MAVGQVGFKDFKKVYFTIFHTYASVLTIPGQASTGSSTRERHSQPYQQDQSREVSGSSSRARREAQGDPKERTDSTTRTGKTSLSSDALMSTADMTCRRRKMPDSRRSIRKRNGRKTMLMMRCSRLLTKRKRTIRAKMMIQTTSCRFVIW